MKRYVALFLAVFLAVPLETPSLKSISLSCPVRFDEEALALAAPLSGQTKFVDPDCKANAIRIVGLNGARYGRAISRDAKVLRIRLAEEKDFSTVKSIRNVAFSNGDMTPDFEKGYEQWFFSATRPNSPAMLFVAEFEGRVIGMMGARQTGPYTMELGEGAVVPDPVFTRKGISRAFIHELIAEGKKRWPRVKTVEAYTRRDNFKAIGRMRAMGFVEDSKFRGNPEHEIRFRANLGGSWFLLAITAAAASIPAYFIARTALRRSSLTPPQKLFDFPFLVK